MASKTKTVWAAVPEFAGLYEVSTDGHVRSLKRRTKTGILGGRTLRPSKAANGYFRVTLSSDGRSARFLLHRLVLTTFVGPCPAGHECRHLDGNKANCSLSNLAWGTRSDNAKDRVRHGTQVDTSGERHGMTRLSDRDALEIIRLRSIGTPVAEVASAFSIGHATVSRIANGKGWAHLQRAST